jgi:lactoylglutathione lyase
MVRVSDIDLSLKFYCDYLGLKQIRKVESEKGRYTNYFLCAPDDEDSYNTKKAPALELTYNWDPEEYTGGRNFGHLAYRVKDIYTFCENLMNNGVEINRPPRDGYMAFIKSPDNISIELLQIGEPLTIKEPWSSMPNKGNW